MFVAVPTLAVAVALTGAIIEVLSAMPRGAPRPLVAATCRTGWTGGAVELAVAWWRRPAHRRGRRGEVPAVIGPIVVALTLAATFLPAVRALERGGLRPGTSSGRRQRRAVDDRRGRHLPVDRRPGWADRCRPVGSRSRQRRDRRRPCHPSASQVLEPRGRRRRWDRRRCRSSPSSGRDGASILFLSCRRSWRSTCSATVSSWAAADDREDRWLARREVGSPRTSGHHARWLHDRDRVLGAFNAVTGFVIMTLLGMPFALPVAVLSFFGGFIPYIGQVRDERDRVPDRGRVRLDAGHHLHGDLDRGRSTSSRAASSRRSCTVGRSASTRRSC